MQRELNQAFAGVRYEERVFPDMGEGEEYFEGECVIAYAGGPFWGGGGGHCKR